VTVPENTGAAVKRSGIELGTRTPLARSLESGGTTTLLDDLLRDQQAAKKWWEAHPPQLTTPATVTIPGWGLDARALATQ
jgi:hypothetical protein